MAVVCRRLIAMCVVASALTVIYVEPCSAQFVIGRYAGEFLSLGAGGRALAMGGAAVASPMPASAVYYNPASLAGLKSHSAEFMHASQFDNAFTYDYLSFVKPSGDRSGLGFTAVYSRVTDIPLTRLSDPSRPISDNNRVEIRKQSGDHEIALMAGIGRFMSAWKTGATAKLLMKSVADESAFGLGLDVGVARELNSRASVALVVRDVSTSMLAWSTGRTEAILPSIVLGGAYRLDLTAANASIAIAPELETHFESRGEAELISAGPASIQPRLGIEYEIAKTVALRGGANGEDITYGAGLTFSSLNIAAAFQNHSDLGFTHRISAGYSW